MLEENETLAPAVDGEIAQACQSYTAAILMATAVGLVGFLMIHLYLWDTASLL